MKLKTIKELEFDINIPVKVGLKRLSKGTYCRTSELKQAAIERVKYYLNKCKNIKIIDFRTETEFPEEGSLGLFALELKDQSKGQDISESVCIAKAEELVHLFEIKADELGWGDED